MKKYESFAYAHDVADAFYFDKGRKTCYTFIDVVVEQAANGSQRLIVVSTINEKTGGNV